MSRSTYDNIAEEKDIVITPLQGDFQAANNQSINIYGSCKLTIEVHSQVMECICVAFLDKLPCFDGDGHFEQFNKYAIYYLLT